MSSGKKPTGWVDPEMTLCSGCRHFEQSLTGDHDCALGLPLVDMAGRSECNLFDPFPRVHGETAAERCDCPAHAGADWSE